MVNKVTEDSCLQRERGRGKHRTCSISRSISSVTFYTISLGVNKALCTIIATLYYTSIKDFSKIIYISTVPGQVKTEYTFHTYLLIKIRIQSHIC